MTQPILSFEEFVSSLRPSERPVDAEEDRQPYEDAAQAIADLPVVDVEQVARLMERNPDWVPMFASVAGLSREGLQRVLGYWLGSAGWVKLLREGRAEDIVQLLGEQGDLLSRLEQERERSWSYGDVLFERAASRTRAARAVGRGRALEDHVQGVLDDLGLPYKLRAQFVGQRREVAPCDVAIPEAGENALIVCAVKIYDRTGSKLTDAMREIERMALVRTPRQYVYAVVDGIGWLGRKADLRRIHDLWTNRSIEGLFSLEQLPAFRGELESAARRNSLL